MKRLVVSAFWMFPPAAFGKRRVKALIEEHNLAINTLHAVNDCTDCAASNEEKLKKIKAEIETYVYHFNKLRSI